MILQASRELQARVASRYRSARRKEKGQILTEFVAATGYGRKYAINRLNQMPDLQQSGPAQEGSRGKRPIYGEAVQQALIVVWKAANCICSKRLVPFLPEFVPALERFGHLSVPPAVRERLLSVSASTVDRLLLKERRSLGRGVSTTKPGQLLKRQIPVRTFNDWNDLRAGFVEADLVAHCGSSAMGSFLNTLVLTDVATGWTQCLALLRRSEADVLGALGQARQRLPFPLLGIDTDNGCEFINHEMLRYCRQEEITFTRCRPYKKNDQAHVEEKNNSVVRRLVGYDRYEGVAAWRDLAALYLVLRLYVNFFQPSLKLLSKQRQGSHVAKKYDQAQTPYQRVMVAPTVQEAVKVTLQLFYYELDPVALLRELERLQDRFWQHAGLATPAVAAVPAPIGEKVAINDAPNSATPPSVQPAALPLPPVSAITRAEPPAESVEPLPASPRTRLYRRNRGDHTPHTWRTRPDPFAEVWRQLHLKLQIDPSQTAKQLFEQLQAQYPDQFSDGQLRTLQRKVQKWRREHVYCETPGGGGVNAHVVRLENEELAKPDGCGITPKGDTAPLD